MWMSHPSCCLSIWYGNCKHAIYNHLTFDGPCRDKKTSRKFTGILRCQALWSVQHSLDSTFLNLLVCSYRAIRKDDQSASGSRLFSIQIMNHVCPDTLWVDDPVQAHQQAGSLCHNDTFSIMHQRNINVNPIAYLWVLLSVSHLIQENCKWQYTDLKCTMDCSECGEF